MRGIRAFSIVLALLAPVVATKAEGTLPTAVGSTWSYEITGSLEKPGAKRSMLVRIAATEKVDGRELLRLETRTDNQLTETRLASSDERGFVCHRRVLPDGKAVTFDPPQAIVPARLENGMKWEVDDAISGSEMHQEFTALSEEDVVVPAGTFRAVHARCEQPWPISSTTDRWLVPSVGLVKSVTSTRGPSGRLLSRSATVLTSFGMSEPTPAPTTPTPSPQASPTVTLEVAQERDGKAVTEFRSDASNIYVRWRGANLPKDATARLAWIAEDVGDIVDPNFIVDETETEITRPDFAARFTLSRPKDGWAAGKYRLELYVEDTLLATVKVTIRD